MFCLTRAFQFDDNNKTIDIDIGTKNFVLIFISGQTGNYLSDNLKVIFTVDKNQTGSDTACLRIWSNFPK